MNTIHESPKSSQRRSGEDLNSLQAEAMKVKVRLVWVIARDFEKIHFNICKSVVESFDQLFNWASCEGYQSANSGQSLRLLLPVFVVKGSGSLTSFLLLVISVSC
ncbi:hypothetical protein DVH24_016604 [Malus domestica]|uniref:Uncharacterized protein n=1 Tax=Malus domestica TaxID=3750 RepID=A0A498HUW4_MALDO|nr:hypothetical protein DVH24_016604 [Malus domestica]